jgi:hypothetical protein
VRGRVGHVDPTELAPRVGAWEGCRLDPVRALCCKNERWEPSDDRSRAGFRGAGLLAFVGTWLIALPVFVVTAVLRSRRPAADMPAGP